MSAPVVGTGTTIHPSAIVDAGAEVGDGVRIGAFSIVGPGVAIGDRVSIASGALIERDTRIGEDCVIDHGAVLGSDPQDLKYKGEPSRLEIGPRTRIREFATLNRGTAAGGVTTVGADCLLMAYTHVAHDCIVGDHVILANAVNLGGHVELADHVTIGGVSGIHQFVRIGAHAFVGGLSRVTQDVPPYLLVDGRPCVARGINTVGLKRWGFSQESLRRLRRLYRTVYMSDLPMREAVDAVMDRDGEHPEVSEFVGFVQSSTRGIVSSG